MGVLEDHGLVGGTNTFEGTNPIDAEKVLIPYVGFVNDQKIIGMMPNRSGDTVALSIVNAGTTLKLLASKGFRDGIDDYVTFTDPDHVAANIANTINILGVTGTAKRTLFGSGTGTGAIINITGLPFQPSKFHASFTEAGKLKEYIYDLSIFGANAILANSDNSAISHPVPVIFADGFRLGTPTVGTPYSWWVSE